MDAKIVHFSELSKFLGEKSSVSADFLSLLGRFKLGHPFSRLKMEKEKGTKSILLLLQYLLIFRLDGQSIHQLFRHQFGGLIEGGKNQFYRFLTRPRMDWRRLLLDTVMAFFRIVKEESIDAELEQYFILDDTTLEKTGFCMEGISRVFIINELAKGTSKRKISRDLHISRTSIDIYEKRADESGYPYEEFLSKTDKELFDILRRPDGHRKPDEEKHRLLEPRITEYAECLSRKHTTFEVI